MLEDCSVADKSIRTLNIIVIPTKKVQIPYIELLDNGAIAKLS